jgi:hypothetical protein
MTTTDHDPQIVGEVALNRTQSRMLWILAALVAFAVALVGLSWMIQGAWLASFPDRQGVMNPPMFVRAAVFLVSLAGGAWMTRNAIRK